MTVNEKSRDAAAGHSCNIIHEGISWRLNSTSIVHVAVVLFCLLDIAVLLHLSSAATITWDTAHYMLSYQQGTFNELMTIAVPLIPKLLWWIEPGITDYRLYRYALSVLLTLPLALTLWRFVSQRGDGGANPNGWEILSWTTTLLLSCFLGNAILIQFWPLGHHDLTSWIYMLAACLYLWAMGGDRPSFKTLPVCLGILSGFQLLIKIPCVGGLLAFFALYVLYFLPKGRKLSGVGLFVFGFLAALGFLLIFISPLKDILAAIEPSKIRFGGAYGSAKLSPVQVLSNQFIEFVSFLGSFFLHYWPLLFLTALLTAISGRWRHLCQGTLVRPTRLLLPVVVTTPLWVTVVCVLAVATIDPSLIESLALPFFPQRYGVLSDYGLPLAEYVLLFFAACLLDQLINRTTDQAWSAPVGFVAIVLAAIPFFMAAGSSQALMHYIQEGSWSFVALALFGLFLLKRPATGDRTFHVVVLCLFLIVQQYKYTTWMSYQLCLDKELASGESRNLIVPTSECATPPLLRYTTPVPGLHRSKGLLFTNEQAKFYNTLNEMLRQAGFRPGDNILGFYGLGGPVYLLGGRSPGTPTYYPAGILGPDFNSRMLALAASGEIRSSFLLINEPLTPDILAVLQQHGLSVENDYLLIGRLPQPDCLDTECFSAKDGQKYTISVYAPKTGDRAAY
ncbi:hypothetical protein [Fundidesulfovibrio putealis]|uniref:hypothetical protein n=1 Tax=Fundidesulfovibrio putealis TaxID=270496 RepID=UPI0012EB4C1E|nr:hypothetical protein [Fundidesulfovibrio putealis]